MTARHSDSPDPPAEPPPPTEEPSSAAASAPAPADTHAFWRHGWRRFRGNRGAISATVVLLLLVLACLLVPLLSPWRYDEADLAMGATGPSWQHWMGTDYFGRDLMARVFFGGRISFTVGLLATAVSFAIGVSWGGVAGYFGRRLDAAMMRLVDVLYAFPFLLLVILVMVFFAGPDTGAHAAYTAVVGLVVDSPTSAEPAAAFQVACIFVVLGAVSWLTMARIVRGQVIVLRERPFVEAARAMGVGPWAIIYRHLLPNALGPIVVYATLLVPQVMLAEAFLSFLGLGTQEPLASWGLLVAGGAETMDIYPWLLVFPGTTLAIALLCLHLVGDGLRDALDPRTRRT